MPLEGMELGRYHLLRLIGRGGMGEVYLAEDLRIPRQVAVKVIQAETVGYPDAKATQEAARLFQREMKIIASLDHLHILPLFDYNEINVNKTLLTYMVMPLLKEGSLTDWLQERGDTERLSVQDVVYLVEQAADALQHAHDLQIIHQDIKPSNFLIRTRKEYPNRPDLLLADFGIAKLFSATATASQTVRGTPAYMAPEQWDGNPVPATDQYALAVMAYLLLTGQVPFQGGPGQIMRQHFTTEPQAPSVLNLHLSKAVDAVILRALAKQSEDRFPSISAFAQAFQQAVQQSRDSLRDTEETYLRGNLTRTVLSSHSQVTEENVLPTNSGNSRKTLSVPTSSAPTLNVSGAYQTSDKRQGSFKAFMLVGLVLLVLLASAGVFYFQGITRPAPNTLDTIATTQANDATAFAATAQANNTHATTPSPTNNAPTTTAANINTFPPAGASLVLNDPLNNNDHGYNWETNPDPDGVCHFTGGAYQVDETKLGTAEYCPAYNTSFASPFAYEVQMTITQGELGGMLVQDNTHGISYYLRFRQNGDYDVVYYDNSSHKAQGPLVASNASPFHTGYNQSNLIAMVVRGSSIDLYVNNQYINSVSIRDYGSGYIGVFVNDKGNPTEAVFRNAKVWTF